MLFGGYIAAQVKRARRERQREEEMIKVNEKPSAARHTQGYEIFREDANDNLVFRRSGSEKSFVLFTDGSFGEHLNCNLRPFHPVRITNIDVEAL